MDAPDRIAEGYVKLALAIDRHLPGYADAYYGPEEWKVEISGADPRPLSLLARDAEQLLQQLAECPGADAARRHYLHKQVAAMRFMIGVLQGNRASVAEEARMLYDVAPRWTDENEFREAHRTLDELLPPGRTLAERIQKHQEEARISIDAFNKLIQISIDELRGRTARTFPLPANDSVAIVFASGKPWPAYNRYLGDFRSVVEVNTDFPFHTGLAVYLVSHELYPGHHTELSIKEERLYSWHGRKEHCVSPLSTPAVTVSEGIAERGRRAIMSDTEWVEWHSEILYPAAGRAHLDAERRYLIERASEKMNDVYSNAVFIKHDQDATDDEVIEYIKSFRLLSTEDARRRLQFIKTPQFRTHYLTYRCGGALVDELLERFENWDHWLNRLLTEPITPEQIRSWMEM